jgi:predicted metal-dependent enzyme (double-stranded beta helix superfamily)
MTTSSKRTAAVAATLAEVRQIEIQHGITRASLTLITGVLQKLADQPELFSSADFPPPQAGSGETSTRYQLNQSEEPGITLYLNSLLPGKTTAPHNHTTWAVIVAIRGEELNRLYQRIDDRSNPELAQLEFDKEITVRPGTAIGFLADDIHSIHVQGEQPTLHFHLYGRPLETLTERIGFDLDSGRIVNYNSKHMKPSTLAA